MKIQFIFSIVYQKRLSGAKNAEELKEAFVDLLLGCPLPLSAGGQKETFQMLVEETLGETCMLLEWMTAQLNWACCVPEGYGHIGCVLGTGLSAEQVTELGKNIAMQIAALNPRFWDKSQVTQDVLDEEKKVMLAQMENDPKMAGKPEQVREKIVMGKLNKFYSENCLLQQDSVRADVFEGSVEAYIAHAAKELGGAITFKTAVRFEKGEGIEKKQENFADEIASLVKG